MNLFTIMSTEIDLNFSDNLRRINLTLNYRAIMLADTLLTNFNNQILNSTELWKLLH